MKKALRLCQKLLEIFFIWQLTFEKNETNFTFSAFLGFFQKLEQVTKTTITRLTLELVWI
jgi:hypothetical protein